MAEPECDGPARDPIDPLDKPADHTLAADQKIISSWKRTINAVALTRAARQGRSHFLVGMVTGLLAAHPEILSQLLRQ